MNEINATLSGLFVNQYNANNRMNWGGVAKEIMKSVYDEFLRDGLITPIEQLPLDEKKSLTEECRKTGEFFTNETLIEKCKALHVIRTINLNT